MRPGTPREELQLRASGRASGRFNRTQTSPPTLSKSATKFSGVTPDSASAFARTYALRISGISDWSSSRSRMSVPSGPYFCTTLSALRASHTIPSESKRGRTASRKISGTSPRAARDFMRATLTVLGASNGSSPVSVRRSPSMPCRVARAGSRPAASAMARPSGARSRRIVPRAGSGHRSRNVPSRPSFCTRPFPPSAMRMASPVASMSTGSWTSSGPGPVPARTVRVVSRGFNR